MNTHECFKNNLLLCNFLLGQGLGHIPYYEIIHASLLFLMFLHVEGCNY